jgi:hypothetical protein
LLPFLLATIFGKKEKRKKFSSLYCLGSFRL